MAKIASRKLGGGRVAMVIGTTIYLYKVSRVNFLDDQEWVCHELKHVQQYQKYGVIRFLFAYVIESIRKGYYHNKFEAEARNSETDSSILQQVHFI